MKAKEDNVALGTLLLGIGVILLLIWVLKVVLSLFLSLAESIVILGFYVVLIYGLFALLLTVYARFNPKPRPKFVKLALAFHHSVALSIKLLFKLCKNLLVGKSRNKSSQ